MVAAVRELGLDVVGLPAARISSQGASAVGHGFPIHGRGETSYASTAVIWREEVGLQVIEQPGGPRRLWCQIPEACRQLMLAILQIPTPWGAERDVEWVKELEELDADMTWWAAHGDNAESADFLFMGNMNMQPDELGGGPEPRGARQRARGKFKSKRNIALHSPGLHGQSPQETILRIRKKTIVITPSSSKHGRSCGRPTDLVSSTINLPLAVKTHNGLHFGGREVCSWGYCMEFAGGDHVSRK